MRTNYSVLVAATALGLAAAPAHALRCGNKLVTEGDHKVKVSDLCGKPSYTDTRKIYRGGIPRGDVTVTDPRSQGQQELALHQRSVVEVDVEVWVYNFGSSKLMREIVFRDDRIVEINVLGRGH